MSDQLISDPSEPSDPQHPDIVRISCGSADFLALWREGFEAYQDGDWPRARDIFNKTETFRKTERRPSMFQAKVMIDGPSQTLLAVMAEHDFIAPANWR